ncbi:PhzF family phenazine biosynthesis protein [Catenulispora sp. EB89]|uniref:PhzF family phenazine biosynthesis protein n=1 Tax=Catenulispora sp. EB89 TaxID=3156257 RepID=UPI003517F83A
MKISIVDAFTDRPFTGNPAAVCVLPEGTWPPKHWLQAVAAEMNLSETAFLKPSPARPESEWELRWFTPATESLLCGHATLAATHVLASDGYAVGLIVFNTRSGLLSAEAQPDGLIRLDFPLNTPTPTDSHATLTSALGINPTGVYKVDKLSHLLAELPDEASVRGLTPDPAMIMALPERALIATARADQPNCGYDFVSRFFAPRIGIPEDPVTGSAHTALAPFWSRRLGAGALKGLQVSARGGLVETEVVGNRVLLAGRAVRVFNGDLTHGSAAAIRLGPDARQGGEGDRDVVWGRESSPRFGVR